VLRGDQPDVVAGRVEAASDASIVPSAWPFRVRRCANQRALHVAMTKGAVIAGHPQ
jgi:hypothetical protein